MLHAASNIQHREPQNGFQVTKLEYRSLAKDVYGKIREAIIAGSLEPGTKLVEGTIAEQLGVSRTPVREAFQRLAVEGFIDVRRGIGAYVREVSTSEVEEVYSIRALLEGLAAERAAQRISGDGLRRLRELAMEPREATLTGIDKTIISGDMLHRVISEESQSPVLRDILSSLYDQLQRFRVANALVPGRRDNALREHKRIYAALEKRDSELARKEMVAHVMHSMEEVLTQIRTARKDHHSGEG